MVYIAYAYVHTQYKFYFREKKKVEICSIRYTYQTRTLWKGFFWKMFLGDQKQLIVVSCWRPQAIFL